MNKPKSSTERRRSSTYYSASGAAPVTMVPVKRVGRRKTQIYCERCGAKRTACRCKDAQDG